MGSNWIWLPADLACPPSGLYLTGIKPCRHFVTSYVLPPRWKIVSDRLLVEGGCWLQNPCGKGISPPPASGAPSIWRPTVWWRRWRWLHEPDHAAVSRRGPRIDNPSAFMLSQGYIGFWDVAPCTSTFHFPQWVHHEELFLVQWLQLLCFFFVFFSDSSLWRQRLISHKYRTPKCIISLFRQNNENPLKVIPAKRAKLPVNGSLDTSIKCCYECNGTIDHSEPLGLQRASVPLTFFHIILISPLYVFFFLFNSLLNLAVQLGSRDYKSENVLHHFRKLNCYSLTAGLNMGIKKKNPNCKF